MKALSKSFTLATLACAFPAAGISAHAREGGSIGGGGNLFESTEQEVRDAIQDSHRMVWAVLPDLAMYGALEPESVSDPSLKQILTRLEIKDEFGLVKLGKDFLFQEYYRNPKLVPSRECRNEDGDSVAASTEFGKPGADICVAVPRLMKLAPEEMKLQLAALWMHEVSHHAQPKPRSKGERAGFETEAQHFQAYFLQMYRNRFASLNQRASATGWSVIFPGGTATEVVDPRNFDKAGPETIRVACVRPGEANKNPVGTIVVISGGTPTIITTRFGGRDADEPDSSYGTKIYCPDFAPRDCSVSVQGVVLFGVHETQYRAQELEDLKSRGICKK